MENKNFLESMRNLKPDEIKRPQKFLFSVPFWIFLLGMIIIFGSLNFMNWLRNEVKKGENTGINGGSPRELSERQ
jgi:hypothetical protein